MFDSDSFIPVTGARLTQLVEDAKSEWETVIAKSLAATLECAEKKMRKRRWWGLVGPWLTTEGPPSDEQIHLWNRHHMFYSRAEYQKKLDYELARLDLFLNAVGHMEHEGTFMLSTKDYERITGQKTCDWF